MKRIESVKNQHVKEWKKLLTRKGRKKANRYFIEGTHLIEEAIQFKQPLSEIIVSDQWNDDLSLPDYVDTYSITNEIAEEISDTETTQGIFAVVEKKSFSEELVIERPFLFLDAVQDPGNVGTMIRSADAAGFQGIVLGEGTVDAYNSKTLRSSQGSHFHIDILEGKVEEWIEVFRKEDYPVFGTALDERAESYTGKTYTEPFALILGNEGSGVRTELLEQTDKNFYIPIKGQAESLNVAIAASILMFSLYN